MNRDYLEQMQAHVDEGGRLTHENAVELLGELIKRESGTQPIGNRAISDDILEAVINEHDMSVPDGLLAAPAGFGAHREAMRAALEKIIPLTLHIEAEYQKAIKKESATKCPQCGKESMGVGHSYLEGHFQHCMSGHKWGASAPRITASIEGQKP